MIGFWLVNLLIPGNPQQVVVHGPSGEWIIDKNAFFERSHEAILKNQCALTYAIEHAVSLDQGSAACDAAVAEMTPLLLGASYLTGLSVTTKQSLPHSEVAILAPSHHWPRERSLGQGHPIISTAADFATLVNAFVAAWPGPGQSEKILLVVHHWLDALGCWSLEDLYLSATTLLQIIAATEERVQGKELGYFAAVTAASRRAGVSPLSRDFKDMRNM